MNVQLNTKRLYIIGVFNRETEDKIRNIRKIYTHEIGKGFLPHITLSAVDVPDINQYIDKTSKKFREVLTFPVTFNVLDYFAPIKAAALFAEKEQPLMDAFEQIRKINRGQVAEYYVNQDIYIPHTTLLWDVFGSRDYYAATEDMKKRKFTPITGTVVQLKYSLMNGDGTFTIVGNCDLRRGKEMKVVGWVDWESDYPDCPGVYSGGNDEYRNSVINLIRAEKLKFSGEQHQNLPSCCPIFEDGTVLRASQREWGAIMADAWYGKLDDWKWDIPFGETISVPGNVTDDAANQGQDNVVSFHN